MGNLAIIQFFGCIHKRSQLERTVYSFPSMFNYILKDFFEASKPPVESIWNRNLRKWAEAAELNLYGLSAKTTRKTIESWMIKAGIYILSSPGT
jgi:hypothetical protein